MIPNSYSPIFQSHFSGKLQAFLANKRSVGYRYESESRMLVRIDKYLLENGRTVIDDETVLGWATKREGESEKTHSIRVSLFKQFCIFLNRGEVVAAMPQRPKNPGFSKSFTPYIFTQGQIRTILKNADTMPKSKTNPEANIRKVMPAMLRLLYCCGLRVSEATSLRIRHVDLDEGSIMVMHSKNDCCRVVPMSESLKSVIGAYIDEMHVAPMDDDFVFPTKKGEQYCTGVIYVNFRELLWRSGIPHGGRGKGPRLHDIRHTFAVHSLQKSIFEGRDTYLLLPILSTYLGHKNIYATEKYLRLTSEMYPDILNKVESALGKLVPEVVDYETS